MNKSIFIVSIFFLLVGNVNCIKDSPTCTNRSVQNEQAAILAYAGANGINGTFLSSGLYYEVINPGTGTTPSSSSTITAHYVGKYISNNTQFDATQGTPAVFPLNGVIAGWQIGIPLIKKGGVIKMIIPSSLAYGCAGYQSVPPDAVLYFEVTLVDVQ